MVQRKHRNVKPPRKFSVNTKKIFISAAVICGVALAFWVSFAILPGFFSENESEEGTPISAPTVEVLNGTNVDGIAAQMTEFLRANDIDVFTTDNNEFPVSETIIINRDFRGHHAEKISELTGVTNVVPDNVTESYVNVTIILGEDYKKYKPFKK